MRLSSAAAQPEALADASPQQENIFALTCSPDLPATLGDSVYFMAASGPSPLRLWKSNGTASGTGPVFMDPDQALAPCHLTAHNDRLYFSAGGGAAGEELWTSDGTSV